MTALTCTQVVRMSIGVPIKLLHESESHTITIELKSGELYRGTLMEVPPPPPRAPSQQPTPLPSFADAPPPVRRRSITLRILHLESSCVVCGARCGEVSLDLTSVLDLQAEDNMNCSMSNVTMTGRDGSISTLEQVAPSSPNAFFPSR